MQEQMEREIGLGNLLMRGVGGWIGEKLGRGNQSDDNVLDDLFASMGLHGYVPFDENDDVEEAWSMNENLGEINEEVESKYLTMSWWLLHVGWKDVGERVRRGVEEVFNGSVSNVSFLFESC